MKPFVIALSLIVLTFAAMRVSYSDPNVDAEAAKAIRKAMADLDAAFNRGDAQGIAALYTEKALLFAPDRPAFEGRSAIAKFNQLVFDMGIKGVASTLSEVEVYNGTAFTSGTFKVWGNDKAAAFDGKFMLLWKKVGGQWLIHRDCGNGNGPAKN
ncbi:MAG: YybH family protein [Planctomycetaceae bacterium]